MGPKISTENLQRMLREPGNAEVVGGYNVDFAIAYPHPLSEVEPVEDTKAGFAMERELQRLCEGFLAQKEIWFKHDKRSRMERKGTPDLLFVIPPAARPCAVEVKSKSGRIKKEQVEVMTRMKANGWEVYLVRTWDEWLGVFDETTKQWEATNANR